jgi:hypothetical protein
LRLIKKKTLMEIPVSHFVQMRSLRAKREKLYHTNSRRSIELVYGLVLQCPVN